MKFEIEILEKGYSRHKLFFTAKSDKHLYFCINKQNTWVLEGGYAALYRGTAITDLKELLTKSSNIVISKAILSIYPYFKLSRLNGWADFDFWHGGNSWAKT